MTGCRRTARSSAGASTRLTRLATGGGDTPLVVLTTVNALVQRVPPRSLFDGRVLTLRPGGRIRLDRLQSFFRNNGYIRTDTVREPGEFAVRGGIVDLYPAGAAEPMRLDFFGDTLESLRSFDPLTQRSTGNARSGGAAPGQRGVARRRGDPALPLALPRAVRRDRHRRPALRIGQRRPALCRHGALAAALLRDAGDAVRLPARRRGVARPPGGRGARPSARSDRRFLRSAPTTSPAQHARGSAALPPGPAGAALSRRPRMAGRAPWARRRPALAVRLARRRRATSSTPAPGRRAISPPSAPTRRSMLFEAVRDYLDAERKAGRRAAIAAYQRGLGRPAR